MSEVVTRTPAAVSFPAHAVTDCLRAELTKVVREDATLTGRVLPLEASALSHMSVELDSLRVVSILCQLDELLGFKVKDAVVKDGGYTSIATALGHLIPRIEREWSRHVSKVTKR